MNRYRVSFFGDLAQFSVRELLFSLAAQRETGALVLRQERVAAKLYVVRGEPVFVRTSRARDGLIRRLFDNELANAATSTTNAAAFQLAVWEIIYETGPDYELSYYDYGDRGTFYAKDGDSIALANEWLADVVAGSGDPLIRLRVLTDPCKQDYSVILPDKPYPASPAIPEPLTAAAMFAAVAGLGTYVRRRN